MTVPVLRSRRPVNISSEMVNAEGREFSRATITKRYVAAVIGPEIKLKRVIVAETLAHRIEAHRGYRGAAVFVYGELQALARPAGIRRRQHMIGHSVIPIGLSAVIESELRCVVVARSVGGDCKDAPACGGIAL